MLGRLDGNAEPEREVNSSPVPKPEIPWCPAPGSEKAVGHYSD